MIGKNIYEIRKQRGLTLSELAERARISKSYLSNIERSLNQNPSIQVVKKIALVLGVEVKTLLKTGSMKDTEQYEQLLEREWLDFINDLKETGIDNKHIHEYKKLIEFIKWQNKNLESNK